MDRKNFILLTGLGISAITIPTWYYTSQRFEYNESLSEPEFLSHIWDDNTISEIGKQYINKYSEENSKRVLASILLNNTTIDAISTPKILRQQIAEDYQKGNTIMIDGWILSKTEARQCALFSLIQND